MLARVAMAPASGFLESLVRLRLGPRQVPTLEQPLLLGKELHWPELLLQQARFLRHEQRSIGALFRHLVRSDGFTLVAGGGGGSRGAISTVSSSRLLVLAARSVLVVGVTVDAVRMVNGEIDATEFGRNTGVGLAGHHNPVTATLSSAYFLNDAFYPGGNNQAGRDFVDEASCVSRTMMGDCYERR